MNAFCFNLPGYREGQGVIHVDNKDYTYDAQAWFSDVQQVVKSQAKIRLRPWDVNCPSMNEQMFKVECENATVSMYADKSQGHNKILRHKWLEG